LQDIQVADSTIMPVATA